jgi:CHAT domain-containing protein/tetratricopeptide (TPR) repeat protein
MVMTRATRDDGGFTRQVPCKTYGRARVVAIVAVLWVALSLMPATVVAAPRDLWPSMRYAAELARADSLRSRGGLVARAYLDSLIGAARAGGNSNLEMVASLRKASARGFFEGAYDSAIAATRPWLETIRATGDTMSWCVALRTIGYADLASTRFASSLVSYRQMLTLSQRARLPLMEGYARIGLSFIAIQNGKYSEAENGYRIAIRLLQGRDAWAARTARAGLANALSSQGRPEAARQEYQRVVAEARAAGDRRNEADALNDLAVIELLYGDPSDAIPKFRDVASRHQALGRQLRALESLANVSICLASLGRLDEQVALADSIARAARSLPSYDLAAKSMSQIAVARRRQGRPSEAEATLREVLRFQDSISVHQRTFAVMQLARTQNLAGKPDLAAKTAREALDSFAPAGSADLLHELGRAELARGNTGEAVAAFRRCAEIVRGQGGLIGAGGIQYETSLASAFRASGQRDSALVHYRLAASLWERLRASPTDLAWRESFDEAGARLYGPYAVALLDSSRGGTARSRAAETFAELQRFRSRTLEDALRGAEGRTVVPRVTLAELQAVLAPEEVVLDVFAAPDTTFLFAVTRQGIRLSTAPGAAQLTPRLRRFRDALAGAGNDETLLAAAAASLGEELLGPVAEVLLNASTVLISAGSLSEFPLGMLRLPGESDPMVSLHRVAFIPSATVLTGARRARARATPAAGLVALSRLTDVEGVRLQGVAEESRWLARRFDGARVRANEGTLSLAAMVGDVGSGDVLHISSHTRGPGSAPWKAGFLLGSGTGEDAYLTASRITQLRPKARVCVLASCTSAGGSTSAEGLPNLASAWLAAGVSTVIATLWKVDDRATATFVRDLYEALARGRTAGEALADAQRAARASGARNAPRDWSGYVLVGDPTTRVSLGSGGPRATSAPGGGPKPGPPR